MAPERTASRLVRITFGAVLRCLLDTDLPLALQVDSDGHSCPSKYPSGWLWFGSEVGWAPAAGWHASSGWVATQAEIDILVKATWWLPAAGWKLSAGIECPSAWTLAGWVDTRIPSTNWTCDKSGMDGFEYVDVLASFSRRLLTDMSRRAR